VKRELEHIEIPGEHEARERAWQLARAAFAEREPVDSRRRLVRPVLVLAAIGAVLAAALSAPGRAELGDVRDAVLPTRVERSQPALFRLPAAGNVLASSDSGAWIVRPDGSRRRLGAYREASWSPFGRFVAAARANELAALEPDGGVRWSFARRGVRAPRWGGTAVDTRIAYLAGETLRVVAGDGTDDHRLARRAARVPVAWRPGPAHVLAYLRGDGLVRVVDADRGTVLLRKPAPRATRLEWVADRLLVAGPDDVTLYDDSGGGVRLHRRGRFATAALGPRAQAVALVRETGAGNVIEIVTRQGRARRLFAGGGRFDNVAWSPDGRWLLVGWPTADQWLFIRVVGRPRLASVSNVTTQLRSRTFPRIEGWCCASPR
jgi:hypothetical protein